MFDKTDIQRLRQAVPDRTLMEQLATQDAGFGEVVARYKSKPPSDPFLEMKAPTYLINKYYNVHGGSYTGQKATAIARQTTDMVRDEGIRQQQKSVLDSSAVEDPSIAGFAGNLVKSGLRFGRDVGSAALNVFNPDPNKNTLVNAGKLAIGGAANAVETLTGNEDTFNAPGEDMASSVGKFYADRYGGIDKVLKTIYEDPVGFASDAATLITGAGGALNVAGKVGGSAKLAQMGKTVAKAGLKAEPVVLGAKAIGKAAKVGGKIAGFGASQMTGLSPETMKFITQHADAFGGAQKGEITRATVAEKFLKATQKQLDDLSDTGKGYEAFRTGKAAAKVDPTFFEQSIARRGFKIDERGKISKDINTKVPATPGEIAQLQNFYDLVRGKGEFTDAQFLNVRGELSELSKFDAAKSDQFRSMAREIRHEWNQTARKQFKGLEDLDNQFSPIVKEAEKLKQEFVDVGADGTATLKEGAIGKLYSLTTKNNTQKLERLKKLVPEIGDDINAIKALEDVTLSSGQKVGTYFRMGVGGAGIATGNPLAVVASIIASPPIAVPILKAYGKVRNVTKAVIDAITEKIRTGQKLSEEQAVIVASAIEMFDDSRLKSA